MKIVILDAYTLNLSDLNSERLGTLGDLIVYDRTDKTQIVERCLEADIILTNKVILGRSEIKQLPHLRLIGILATGYNGIDLAYAKERNITVSNIPAYSTNSVAQMVFSQILNFCQNINTHAEFVKQGKWSKSKDFTCRLSPQIELTGKTLGIIGFGRIGQAVARLGLAFGMRVIYQNRSKKQTDMNAYQVNLAKLLKESDFISINCPLTENNLGFVDQELLEQMKNSAFLVNTGRGPLINEQDLANALNNEQIAGAGLDVLSLEPPTQDNPLIGAKNCYITPHIAWATLEARQRLVNILCDNIEAFQNNAPINVVN